MEAESQARSSRASQGQGPQKLDQALAQDKGGQKPRLEKRGVLRPGKEPGPPTGWNLKLDHLIPKRAPAKHARSGGLARLSANLRKDKQDAAPTEHIKISTANGTGWGSMQEYLKHSNAHVVCGQEHHLDKDQIDEASQWCLRNGFKSVWGPATRDSVTGGTSGGTAVFVRKQFGSVRRMIT